jgi:hypothetical protein
MGALDVVGSIIRFNSLPCVQFPAFPIIWQCTLTVTYILLQSAMYTQFNECALIDEVDRSKPLSTFPT